MAHSLSIFFPCYNDARTIETLVKEAFKIAPTLVPEFEVIVVNDGSSDDSAQALKELQKTYSKLIIITHPKNRGYGVALRSGFAASTKDLVFYTDGDGQYKVNELPVLFGLMSAGVDFVNGIKTIRHDAQHRIIIGNLYSFLARWLFFLPLTDVDCDYRLIRQRLLKKIKLRSSSGQICIELVKSAQRAGAEFREVSIHHYERSYGKSQFFSFKHISTTFSGFASLWFQLIFFHYFHFPKLGTRLYYSIVGLILAVALVTRLIPALGNNFYFTMDQANDAVHVREILQHHKLPLLGPQTSIFGLYTGPLWYYFLAIGYGLFGGHPFGGIFMLIILNVVLLYIIIRQVSIEVSPIMGTMVGTVLLTSWTYYDHSRYAFNPFPNLFLGIVGLFLLTDFWRGKVSRYIWAAIPFGLFFHTDIAPAIPANIFYVGLGVVALIRHKLQLRRFVAGLAILVFTLLPHVISELTTNFSQFNTLRQQLINPYGIFNSFQVSTVSQRFFIILSRSVYRQIPELGVLGLVIVLIIFFRKLRNQNVRSFTKIFIILSLTLLIISWLFFITNLGWRDWHTAYLSPIILLAFLLAVTEMPTLLGIALVLISLYSHLHTFVIRYQQNLHPTDDPSLLVNEVAAVDWTYQKSNGQSFSSYAYLPSTLDYPYQYLYWWHGLAKYSYLPCEYAPFPGSPIFYLPNSQDYRSPTKDCPSNLRFYIIEPDENNIGQSQFLQQVNENTQLIEEDHIGKITVKKLLVK